MEQFTKSRTSMLVIRQPLWSLTQMVKFGASLLLIMIISLLLVMITKSRSGTQLQENVKRLQSFPMKADKLQQVALHHSPSYQHPNKQEQSPLTQPIIILQ